MPLVCDCTMFRGVFRLNLTFKFQISNVQILLNVILILKAETFTQFQLMI
jgi:hypothetical protein